MGELTRADRALLTTIVKQGKVHYRFEPCPRGAAHAKLVDSTLPRSRQADCHRLALAGLLACEVDGDAHTPHTTVRYSLTAMGRDALGMRRAMPAQVHRQSHLSEDALAQEGLA